MRKQPSDAVRAALTRELLQGWRTLRELHEAIGTSPEWIAKCLPVLAQPIFKRHRETRFKMVAEYRLFPEAIGVRKG